MQSNRTRALVAIGSIVVIVALLIVFAGGDDGGDETTVAQTTTTTTESGTGETAGKPEKPPKPEIDTIVVKGGEPQGGVQDLSFEKGADVRFEVRSDTADEVHVHGYDLSEDVEAGGKVEFDFPADIDGVFEVELEAAGVQLAQLTVQP